MTETAVLDEIRLREKSRATLPDHWDYGTFKDYLLALSRGNEFRQPIEKMPKQINLSTDWHQVLDRMRADTASDMKERYINLGFKEDRNGLVVPREGTKGLAGNVPAWAIQFEDYRMKYKGKTDGNIGNIHSHPRDTKNTRPLNFLTNRGAFSLADMYTLIYSGSKNQLIGVVDGSENIFAIKTRESQDTKAPSQDKFVEAWYRRNGWTFLGRDSLEDGERATPLGKDSPSIQELNRRVAAEYGIALYRGDAGKALKRVYPEIPKPKFISRINPFSRNK